MSPDRKRYIHIGGMDLAGKTSVSTIIAQKSRENWKIHNKYLTEGNPIHELSISLSKADKYDDEIYGYLFFTALLADIKNYKKNENIIQDSALLLRSIVFHNNKANKELAKLFEGLIEKHPVPDVSIYLTANIRERQRRLMLRKKEFPSIVSNSDMIILENPVLFEKMDHDLMDLSKKHFKSIVIDNSNMTAEQTAEKIMNIYEL